MTTPLETVARTTKNEVALEAALNSKDGQAGIFYNPHVTEKIAGLVLKNKHTADDLLGAATCWKEAATAPLVNSDSVWVISALLKNGKNREKLAERLLDGSVKTTKLLCSSELQEHLQQNFHKFTNENVRWRLAGGGLLGRTPQLAVAAEANKNIKALLKQTETFNNAPEPETSWLFARNPDLISNLIEENPTWYLPAAFAATTNEVLQKYTNIFVKEIEKYDVLENYAQYAAGITIIKTILKTRPGLPDTVKNQLKTLGGSRVKLQKSSMPETLKNLMDYLAGTKKERSKNVSLAWFPSLLETADTEERLALLNFLNTYIIYSRENGFRGDPDGTILKSVEAAAELKEYQKYEAQSKEFQSSYNSISEHIFDNGTQNGWYYIRWIKTNSIDPWLNLPSILRYYRGSKVTAGIPEDQANLVSVNSLVRMYDYERNNGVAAVLEKELQDNRERWEACFNLINGFPGTVKDLITTVKNVT